MARYGDEVMAPDGYKANGDTRPWKAGTVVGIAGKYLHVRFADGNIKNECIL